MRTDTSKPAILKKAIALASKRGLYQFSRVDVAAASGVGESTVSYHFKTMRNLRKQIVIHAVEHRLLSILADACAGREKVGVEISGGLLNEVATYIKTRN